MTTYRPTQILPPAARNGGPVSYGSARPGPQLEAFVVRYWQMSSRGELAETVRHRVVPDGCIDVIFDLGGSTGDDSAIVFGPATGPHLADLNGKFNYLGVCFRPGAFCRLFGVPASELTDRIFLLEDMAILPGSLAEQLQSCRRFDQQARLLDQVLSGRLEQRHGQDDRLNAALAATMETAGNIGTPELARRVHLSPRQFRRLFDRFVGLSPKALARIVRFQKVLGQLARNGPRPQLPLALTAGYYDQAHFLHDFQALTGKSPTALLSGQA